MLSRIRKIFTPKIKTEDQFSIQICPIHGKTIFLQHMVNSRCAICDGYTREELRNIIRRIKENGE